MSVTAGRSWELQYALTRIIQASHTIDQLNSNEGTQSHYAVAVAIQHAGMVHTRCCCGLPASVPGSMLEQLLGKTFDEWFPFGVGPRPATPFTHQWHTHPDVLREQINPHYGMSMHGLIGEFDAGPDFVGELFKSGRFERTNEPTKPSSSRSDRAPTRFKKKE